jgi:hypothetical protein
MVEYVARMTTLKNQFFAVKKDMTKQAAVTIKLGEKAYSGMNAKSNDKYRGIIITRDAKNNFAKIKAIIDEQVRDDQIRLMTRGETEPQKEARAMVATTQLNRRSKTKELGPIVPAKLYVTNLNYKMTTEELKAAFSKHGTVDEVDIVSVRGRPIGFGFVTYKNAADAENA